MFQIQAFEYRGATSSELGLAKIGPVSGDLYLMGGINDGANKNVIVRMDSSDNIKYVISFNGLYTPTSLSIDGVEGKIGALIANVAFDLNIYSAADGSFVKRYKNSGMLSCDTPFLHLSHDGSKALAS